MDLKSISTSINSKHLQSSQANVGGRIAYRSMLGTALYVLTLLVFSLFYTGCGLYQGNHSLQIPLVHLFNDPTLYPNDPFAVTLPEFGSMLWRLVAWVSLFAPLPLLLVVLFVVERLFVILAAGCFARAIAPGSKLAYFGTMALFALAPASLLAQGTIVTFYFEQTGLAVAFILMAMASFYNRRPLSWAIWTALAFNMQSMYGAYALTYFAAAFVFGQGYTTQWKSWAKALPAFFIIALPNILLTLSDFRNGTTNTQLWVAASRLRFSPHLFPMTWGKECFIQYGTLSCLALILTYLGRKNIPGIFRHTVTWTVVGAVWIVYAFAAGHLALPSMLVMQPGRATDLYCCFAAVAIISACAQKLNNATSLKYLVLAAYISSVFLWESSIYTIIILAVTLITAAYKPVFVNTLQVNYLKWSTAILLVLVACCTIVNLHSRIRSYGNIGSALIIRPEAEMVDVASWANQNSSKESVFLVSLRWDDFRALADRPVFTTWKDGAGILWHRSFVTEWASRLRSVGLDITDQRLNSSNVGLTVDQTNDLLNDTKVQSIQSKYPIRYWVVSNSHKSNFPVIYHNRKYKVLSLQ